MADYSAALALHPDDADALNARGSAYDNLGRYAKAVTDFTAAATQQTHRAHAQQSTALAAGLPPRVF